MSDAGEKGFWLSTAAAAKFDKVIYEATGLRPDLPAKMKNITSLPRRYDTIAADAAVIKDRILR